MATIFVDPDTGKPLAQHPKGNGTSGDAVTKFGPGLTGGHPWAPEGIKNASNASRGTDTAPAPIEAPAVTVEAPEGFPCDQPGCTTVAKSRAGLGAHKRSHA